MRFTIALPFFAGTCASVPIPKFAIPCSTLSCELRNQRDTSKVMILVPLLNPKFAVGFAASVCELRVRGTSLLLEHDLFRKPVSTFRDHALAGTEQRSGGFPGPMRTAPS